MSALQTCLLLGSVFFSGISVGASGVLIVLSWKSGAGEGCDETED